MVNITIRLFHLPSRTPILELQDLDPNATAGSLRAIVEDRLASEEACPMRVFVRWHVEMAVGGRKRHVEITDEDRSASLSTLGIEDYSEMLLEGPLTEDLDGIGQAIAIIGAHARRQNSQLLLLVQSVADKLTKIEEEQRTHLAVTRMTAESLGRIESMFLMNEHKAEISDCEHRAREAVVAGEQHAFGVILGLKVPILGDPPTSPFGLTPIARSFSIDYTTPLHSVILKDPQTACKIAHGWTTLRSSQPLTPLNNRWAVKIHAGGDSRFSFMIGLLPLLSAEKVSEMGSTYIKELGGWCIHTSDTTAYVYGDWQCIPIRFAPGDVVALQYSFTARTLTISCGDRTAVGYLTNVRPNEQFYPAFSFCYPEASAGFSPHPLATSQPKSAQSPFFSGK